MGIPSGRASTVAHAEVACNPARPPLAESLTPPRSPAHIEFRKAIDLSGGNTTFESNLAHAYAVSGRKDEATRIVRDLENRNDQNASADASIALVYVGLGDNDRAMSWLGKAYEARFNPSILLRPAFDPLRPDGRFQDLLQRIGMPRTTPDARGS